MKMHRGGEQISKVTDLIIDKFGVSVGGKELIMDTQLKLVVGRKYGMLHQSSDT